MYKYICFLAAVGLLFCGSAALAQNADTVDGFHAYGTPTANALLALNGAARMSGAVIANNSMPGSRLVPGAVTAGRLGNNSVTTDKISDGQVMGADLAAGSVTSSKIVNNTITHGKIQDGTIRGADMYVPLSMSAGRYGSIISATNTNSWYYMFSTPVAVYGYASGSGWVRGVYGTTSSSTGYGTYGYASSTTGSAVGAYGYSRAENGKGVMGYCGADSGANYGVYGEVRSGESDCYAVYGKNYDGHYGALGTGSYGVYGRHQNGNYAYLGSGYFGIVSITDTGIGILGSGGTAPGIWGYTSDPSQKAIYCNGDSYVSGDFTVSGTKAFKIDHPLDPENMYLMHSCIESAERVNVYSGNVVLDQSGSAWVELPDWFEAINGDFRYNLTPIGAPGPNLFIAQEIQDAHFRIAGGIPGTKVSWQVTGVRQDAYARANPFEVEVEKPEVERGSYLHPEVYGLPTTMSVEWVAYPEVMKEIHGGE